MKHFVTTILAIAIMLCAVFGTISVLAEDGGIRAKDLVPDVDATCEMADKYTIATEIILEETILEETILEENIIS